MALSDLFPFASTRLRVVARIWKPTAFLNWFDVSVETSRRSTDAS